MPGDLVSTEPFNYLLLATCRKTNILGCDDFPKRTCQAKDPHHCSLEEEKMKHKKTCLVQSPSSYFMDVKCPGCSKITTVFSHALTVVLCISYSTVLCQSTGGKPRLTEGCTFRRKQR
ncbi:40S ribosomal protein S27-like [Mastomys coucha]|uniref:40S ribosomal protein S27-like n=1 Tax=Mastomys coucha TaxID=35658 RepID=UPI0012621DE4|nr:40S ribosomal protein S27-like [Mastomys coucha]